MTLDPNSAARSRRLLEDVPPRLHRGAAIARHRSGGRAASFATDGFAARTGRQSSRPRLEKSREKMPSRFFTCYVSRWLKRRRLRSNQTPEKMRPPRISGSSLGWPAWAVEIRREKDKEVSMPPPNTVGIRMYKITLNEDLKPGEYAFFMAQAPTKNSSGASPLLRWSQPAPRLRLQHP